jgi:hypothetical protein
MDFEDTLIPFNLKKLILLTKKSITPETLTPRNLINVIPWNFKTSTPQNLDSFKTLKP